MISAGAKKSLKNDAFPDRRTPSPRMPLPIRSPKTTGTVTIDSINDPVGDCKKTVLTPSVESREAAFPATSKDATTYTGPLLSVPSLNAGNCNADANVLLACSLQNTPLSLPDGTQRDVRDVAAETERVSEEAAYLSFLEGQAVSFLEGRGDDWLHHHKCLQEPPKLNPRAAARRSCVKSSTDGPQVGHPHTTQPSKNQGPPSVTPQIPVPSASRASPHFPEFRHEKEMLMGQPVSKPALNPPALKSRKAFRDDTVPPPPPHVQDAINTLSSSLRKSNHYLDETPVPDKYKLLLDDDQHLLTHYQYYLMAQLRHCHFVEEDRKTKGGTRRNMEIGFGGLACIHCAPYHHARRFFWRSCERVANSFSEISDHIILRCRVIPASLKKALLTLKEYHEIQMKNKQIPHGSRTVYFERVWRRIHHDTLHGLPPATGDHHSNPHNVQKEASWEERPPPRGQRMYHVADVAHDEESMGRFHPVPFHSLPPPLSSFQEMGGGRTIVTPASSNRCKTPSPTTTPRTSSIRTSLSSRSTSPIVVERKRATAVHMTSWEEELYNLSPNPVLNKRPPVAGITTKAPRRSNAANDRKPKKKVKTPPPCDPNAKRRKAVHHFQSAMTTEQEASHGHLSGQPHMPSSLSNARVSAVCCCRCCCNNQH